jgi:hypothetical protein
MKLPLHYDMPARHSTTSRIKICDADNKVVCTVPRDEFRLADMIVRRSNRVPLFHRIFGVPRDQRQREYDAWIAQRN